MKLTIDIDLNTDSREQIAMVANLLNTVTNASRRPTSTQPQVVENSGSTGPALDLSPGDSAVTGAAVPGEPSEPNAAPVVVKEAKRRAKKEDAAAPVEKSAGSAGEVAASYPSTPPASAAAEQSSPVTLDDVRTALQAFTAAKGGEVDGT